MANDLMIPNGLGSVSTVFQNVGTSDDLSSGVGQSFGVISYKGKVWAIKYQGESTVLMRDDGDGPRGSIEVVVVKASAAISKIFYEKGYSEGDNAAPDCWSVNGVTPDPASSKKQSNTCAGCPKNVFGSRMTEDGKKAKACSDSRRLAVVPLADISNEMFGGPMLLRVPATSLKTVAQYGDQLKAVGYPYFGVGTRFSFDPNEAYPSFQLKAIRALTDAEAKKVLELQNDERTQRILNQAVVEVTHEPKEEAPSMAAIFEQPPAEEPKPEPKAEAPKAEAPKAEEPKAKPVIKPKPKEEPAPRLAVGELEDGTEVEYDLDTGEVVRVLKEAPKPEPAKPIIKPKAKPAAEKEPAQLDIETAIEATTTASADASTTTGAPDLDALLDGLLAKQ